MKKFSIVLPIYKNEENLPVTIPTLLELIPTEFADYSVEIVMVNDGSPDNSYEIMKEYQRKYPDIIKLASFTRNFGQGAAWNCGIEIASGDAIGVISADLQDPPELFAEMLKYWEEGYQLVYGTRKSRHDKGSVFSKITHHLVHKYINPDYPKGGFDFFLLDRAAARIYLENYRAGSIQLQLLWHNFKTISVDYERREREIGKSAWTFPKKITAFIDLFAFHSVLPMRVMSVTGIISAFVGFLFIIYIIIVTCFFGTQAQGWSSLMCVLLFFFGLILFSLGVIGEYIWRIFYLVKDPPTYIVKEVIETTKIETSEKQTADNVNMK